MGGDEGDCFQRSNGYPIKLSPIKTMEEIKEVDGKKKIVGIALQCPCEGNLCNGSPKMVRDDILLVTLVVFGSVLRYRSL